MPRITVHNNFLGYWCRVRDFNWETMPPALKAKVTDWDGYSAGWDEANREIAYEKAVAQAANAELYAQQALKLLDDLSATYYAPFAKMTAEELLYQGGDAHQGGGKAPHQGGQDETK